MKFVDSKKYLKKNNPVVYAIDLSQAVFALILCGLVVYTTGASCFKAFPCSLSSCFFILFRIVITSRGEGGAGLCVTRSFFFFSRC